MKTREKFIEEIYVKVEKAEAAEREKRIKRIKIYRRVTAVAACFIVAIGVYSYSTDGFRNLIGMKAEETVYDTAVSNVNGNIPYAKADETEGGKSEQDTEDMKAYNLELSDSAAVGKENGGSDINSEESIAESNSDESDYISDADMAACLSEKAKLSLLSIEAVSARGTKNYTIDNEEDAAKIEEWIETLSPNEAMGYEKFNEMYGAEESGSYYVINLTKETKELNQNMEKGYIQNMHNPDRFDIDSGEESGYTILTWYIAGVKLPQLDAETKK